MLGWTDYRILNRLFLSLAAFIDQSTRNKRKTTMTKVLTRFSEITCDLTGGEGQRAWTEEISEMLDVRVKAFKRMLVDTFNEHCDLSLYKHKCHLQNHMVKDLNIFSNAVFTAEDIIISTCKSSIPIEILHKRNKHR